MGASDRQPKKSRLQVDLAHLRGGVHAEDERLDFAQKIGKFTVPEDRNGPISKRMISLPRGHSGIPLPPEAKRFDIARIFGYLTKGSPSAFVGPGRPCGDQAKPASLLDRIRIF